MIVLVMKTMGGSWHVVLPGTRATQGTPQKPKQVFPYEKFDAALQFAVGWCSQNELCELQLDHSAIKEIEGRYLKDCPVKV